MTLRVLAFDIASKTGCAFGVVGGAPKAWTVNLAKGGADEMRLARAIQMTAFCITRLQPDVVAVEAPVGGRDANALLIGLAACVKGEAARRGCKVVEYFPSTVRKHFMGKAKTSRDFPGKKPRDAKIAIKTEVLRKCVSLGWDVAGLDAADACSLWDFACAMECRDHRSPMPGELFAEGRG